jgi:Domain of unknown function (DU1801)
MEPDMTSNTRNKTQATDASVDAYITSRGSAEQQRDCKQLIQLLSKITGSAPRMWGPSIVGFGAYRYTYESGRQGESCLTGFAIRKAELVVYLTSESDNQAALLATLGKHKMGKACLYFKRLIDLDPTVLERLVTASVAETQRRYGPG